MVPELEKPKVTEINVRMDCNGCVQKIKKALHGINGIYDIYIDMPQQKLTIIGWADPERIVKAIKKTRKTATICSHTEPEPEEGDTANPPGEETPAEEQPPPMEPENPPPDTGPAPQYTETPANQPPEVEEVHVVYRYPPDRHYSSSHGGLGFRHEPPQQIVNHGYNMYKPTPYVTEYEYIRPPPPPRRYATYSWPEPPPQYTHYNRPEPPSQLYSRPKPPREHYSQSETYSQPEQPPQHYSRPEPPPPQNYSRPEPPPETYSQPEQPPQHHSQPEPPPPNYIRPEAPRQYIHYNRPEPSQPYSNYRHPGSPPPERQSRVEPSPLHTYYSRFEPPEYTPPYNGEITSPFGEEDPNGCRIV